MQSLHTALLGYLNRGNVQRKCPYENKMCGLAFTLERKFLMNLFVYRYIILLENISSIRLYLI